MTQPDRRRLMQALASAALWPVHSAHASSVIDRALAALVENAPLAGMAVRFSVGNQLLYSAEFGHRHWDGTRGLRPMQADSLFRIASVSKLMVALAAARLHQAGRMDLDAPLYVRGKRLQHPAHPRQTVSARHLLTHTSGLRDRTEIPPLGATALGAVLADASTWDQAAPGQFFSYCNLAFPVLATGMESACGQRFDHLMAEWLFKPLGLQAQFDPASLTQSQRLALATCYRWQQEGWHAQVDDWRRPRPAKRVPADYRIGANASAFGPQGGLRASLIDMDLVAACLQRGGDALFGRDTMAELLRPHWTWDETRSNGETEGGLFREWGLGVQRFTGHTALGSGDALLPSRSPQAWGHLGEAYGLVSGLLFSPDTHSEPGWRLVYAINGTPDHADQVTGHYSGFTPWEETLFTAVLGPRLNPTS